MEGTQVSHYRVIARAGAGGMATVYLADDLKHGRRVALKVLHPDLAAALGSERFLAEIRTTANLQHPNILPLFDSGEVDGKVFYVMPFVEGESLRERLTRDRQLPLDEAVRIAQLVAGALDHAHRHGIIHRDIKPENILLSEGQPLVADFGVALALSAAGGPRLTQSGLAVGTPLYMSPEQAAGDREVDRRTDIYSLAAVLYEMLAGEPPFTGTSAAAVTAKKMLESVPSVRTVRDTVPGALDAVLRKAMARTAADRFATAQQFADALEFSRTLSGAAAVDPSTPSGAAIMRPGRSWLIGAAVLAGVIAGSGWLAARWVGRQSTMPPPVTFELPVEPLAVSQHGPAPVLAFSPDGRRLAYVSGPGLGGQLYLTRLDGKPPVAVAGVPNALGPFFSPDGAWVGYADPSDWMIKKVPVDGGVPVPVARAFEYHGGTWGPDGTIVFCALEERTGQGQLWRVADDGSDPTLLLATDSKSSEDRWLTYPSFLPDGRQVLFVSTAGNGRALRLDVLDLKTGERRTVLDRGGWARYLAPGYLIFAQDSALHGVRFDAGKARVTGRPVRLRDDVMMNLPMEPGLGHFDVASHGTLAYLAGLSYHEATDGLGWTDRTGRVTPLPDMGLPAGAALGTMTMFRVSPDGRRLLGNAVTGLAPTGSYFPWMSALFLYDLDRATLTRLSAEQQSTWWALWAPEERMVQMIQGDSTPASVNLFLRSVRGTGRPEPLTALAHGRVAIPWSLPRDGSRVFYFEHDGARNAADIWMVSLDAGAKPEALFAQPTLNETDPAISPDGKWLAYVTNETGTDEVYLTDFPGMARRWQVSDGGGNHPAWHPSSRELFFTGASVAEPFALWSVALTPEAPDPPDRPRLLFESPNIFTQLVGTPYDVAPDGSRFLILRKRPVDRTAIARLTVVANWLGEVRAQVR